MNKLVQTGEEYANTDYLSGFQYRSSYTNAQGDQSEATLQYFPHAEGYVQYVDGMFFYVYNYTDHLGNIRLSYTYDYASGLIKIMEENHYYPFGLKHDSYNTNRLGYSSYTDEDEVINYVLDEQPKFVGDGSYNYKYNGKELQDELGLNMYDYGARGYMPDIGRTTTIDPLAESFFDMSPQSFFNNNPIYFIDPTGMSTEGWITQEIDGEKSITYNSEVNTVEEAVAAGYEGVTAVNEALTVSATDGSYSYNLNANGTVSDTSGNQLFAGVNRNFTTGAGTNISSWGLVDLEAVMNRPPAMGNANSMDFTSPFFSWGWAVKGLGHAWSSVFGTATKATAEASGSVYSVAYQTTLSSELFPGGSYYAHFKAANTALEASIQADATVASSMSQLGISIPRSSSGSILGKSPSNWVWHHSTETGVMQLVPKAQHTSGSIFWDTMHPNGFGGMFLWNK